MISITPFFHVYHKYVFIMSNINKIRLSGTTYSIQDLNATKTVELTQAQYDALSVKDPNTFYIITDAEAGDLSNYYTKSETSGATEISTALNAKADTATTYTKTETDNAITAATSTKQDTLVSGTNIKTINGETLLGEGNITIQGGGGDVTVDQSLDSGSTNPVANSAITNALNDKINSSRLDKFFMYELGWNNNQNRWTYYLYKPTTQQQVQSNFYYLKINGYPAISSSTLTNLSLVETSAFTAHTADTVIHVTSDEKAAWNGKQDTLVSGTNIKTINNQSILGEGNITIQGGGGGSDINVVQTTGTSTADVMSQDAVTTAINEKADKSTAGGGLSTSSENSFDILRLSNQNGQYITGYYKQVSFSKINNKHIISQGEHNPNSFSLVETSAITTTITSSSTDAQVPSAKAVYDMVGNINTILESI